MPPPQNPPGVKIWGELGPPLHIFPATITFLILLFQLYPKMSETDPDPSILRLESAPDITGLHVFVSGAARDIIRGAVQAYLSK